MSNYKSYFIRQLGIKESQDITTEGFDRKELATGINVEKEHTDDANIAAQIAKDHLREDPHYYTKLTKAGLEETNKLSDLISPTRGNPVIGMAVRGSSTGGLPSGAMPTLGPTSLTPSSTEDSPKTDAGVDIKSSAALGGLEKVQKQTPNSTIVDKTPKNDTIDSAEPIAKDVPETPADGHPSQVQQIKTVAVQALTGTTDDPNAPSGDIPHPENFATDDENGDMSLKGACPKGIDVEVPGDEESEEGEEHGEEHDEEEKEELHEGKHKSGCKCGFCMNKGKFGKKKNDDNDKNDKNDDNDANDKNDDNDKNDKNDSNDKKSKKPFGTSLDEVFARHSALMKEKLNLEDKQPVGDSTPINWKMDKEKAGMVKVDEDVKECKPCGCNKPNTVHDKKTKKITTEKLQAIHEQLVKKSEKVPLTEQETKIADLIVSTLIARGSK